MHEHKMATPEIEMTFAVNVLGHHLLYRLMIERSMFAENPRIVMTSGDPYIMSNTCEPNPNEFGSHQVYGGSKLGNMWQMRELVKRYPEIKTYAIHPGVVLSGFGGIADRAGYQRWLAGKLLVSEEQGAQAALITSTQDIPSGTYWHNVWGVMDLPQDDTSMKSQKSAAFWGQLETLSADHL